MMASISYKSRVKELVRFSLVFLSFVIWNVSYDLTMDKKEPALLDPKSMQII